MVYLSVRTRIDARIASFWVVQQRQPSSLAHIAAAMGSAFDFISSQSEYSISLQSRLAYCIHTKRQSWAEGWRYPS